MGTKKILNHNDFLSAKIHINLRNLVSQTVVASNVKTIGNFLINDSSDENLVQLLEILPKGAILSVPSYTCAQGHQLEIEITVSNLAQQPYSVKLQGKVQEAESTSNGQNRIKVEFKTYSEEKWLGFCQLFSNKQEDIMDYIKKIRGY